VNEEVGHVDIVGKRRRSLLQVGLDDAQTISVGGKFFLRKSVAISDQGMDFVPGFQKLREEPEADVPICASEENSHRREIRFSEG
jgi:hypothetical protein